MVIGSDKLLALVREKGLIKNLSKRELVNPEGPGFDLRLGAVYSIAGEGFLGCKERQTPSPLLVAQYKKEKTIVLKPGDYYLAATIEEVNIPKNIFAHVFSRTTLFRSGVQLIAGKVSPGYYGKLVFGLANLGPARMEIELGARFAFIVFHELSGFSNSSRGQWKGGRIAAEKKELQV